jgi:type II secretory pathway pseudopilin PulG
LAILGLIAVFTIPKVLQAQHDSKWNAMTKEAMAATQNAVWNYKLEVGLTDNTEFGGMVNRINFVKSQPCGLFDSSSFTCLTLHSGGVLAYRTSNGPDIGDADNPLCAWKFHFFPGGYSNDIANDTVNPNDQQPFFVYSDGALRADGETKAGTGIYSCGNTGWGPGTDGGNRSWFSW